MDYAAKIRERAKELPLDSRLGDLLKKWEQEEIELSRKLFFLKEHKFDHEARYISDKRDWLQLKKFELFHALDI